MTKSRGYLSLTSPAGLREHDTLTCCHCNRLIVLNPDKAIEGGYCGNCSGVICAWCSADGHCRPFEKWLDVVEKRAYRNSQLTRLGIV